MSSPPSVTVLLDRLSSTHDRDHRFVALKDLHSEITKIAALSLPSSTFPPSNSIPPSATSTSTSTPSSSPPSQPLDTTSESKIVHSLLLQLLTSSSELQELTVATLTLLIPILHTSSASSLFQSLLSYTFDPSLSLPGQRSSSSQWKGREYEENEEEEEKGSSVDRRQAALSALLSIIPSLRRDDAVKPIAEKAIPLIMDGVEKEKVKGGSGQTGEFLLDLLSLLSAFLSNHSNALDFLHADVLQFLLSLLSSTPSRLTVKASIACLASLAPHLSPPLFTTLVGGVKDRYGVGDPTSFLLIASLASSSSALLSPHVPSLLRLLLKSASAPLPAESQRKASEEREGNFIAIDGLIRGCGADVLGETTDVMSLVKVLQVNLTYDPNYVGADDEDMSGEGEEEGEGDDAGMEDMAGGTGSVDDEYVEGMSDDEVVDEEDTSGMVRRAASKCVLALLSSMSSFLSTSSTSSFSASKSKTYLLLHSTLSRLTEQLAPLLLSRFHERTDHILIDLLHSFERCIDIARALRLSVTSLLPQPQLNKAVTALVGAKGKAKSKLSHSTIGLLTHSYQTLAVVLNALPPHTILSQLHSLLASLSAVISSAEKDPTPATAPLLASTFDLLTALIIQVGPGEWGVKEVEWVGRLIVGGVNSDRGIVVEAAFGAMEELIEMLNVVGLMRFSQGGMGQVDVTFLPMTLLDAACEVESEEERRKSWMLRGEAVSTSMKALTSSALDQKQVTAINASTATLVPTLHKAVVGVLKGGGERGVKVAALNTLGLLYSHLPVLASSAAPAADVLTLLQPCIDSPLTRGEATQAVSRIARCISFLTPTGAVHPPLLSIAAALIGYLKQTDRTLQHSTMAALNTLILRVMSISLHQATEASQVRHLTVLPALNPLVLTLVTAFSPLHALLSLPGDWMMEMDSLLTLLSHLTLLSMSCTETQPSAVMTLTSDTFPRLMALVSALPSSALAYSLSLSLASVYSLYYFTSPASPPISSIRSAALSAFAASTFSSHRYRVLSMIVAASILSSTIGSVRGFSEVKAEIGWLPPAPPAATPLPTQPLPLTLRSTGEDDIGRYIQQQMQVVEGSAPREEKTFAFGVLGEIGRVHSLSPTLYPSLMTSLVPVGDEGLDVDGATAFGLITIGNPVAFFPHLTALMGPTSPATTSALALHSLHELLHHLAHHQVVALSHPFNSTTVQPHSIPFPSTSLILLIQSLSASITDTILPILFSLSTSPSLDTSHLAVNSLTRLMALFPAPTLTAVQSILQSPSSKVQLVVSVLESLSSFVSVYLSSQSPPLPSQSIDAHHRHNVTRPKILPPTSIFTAQLFSLLPTIIPLLTSPSLALRSAAVTLLSSVAVHSPQLLTVHLGILVREWEGFVRREGGFVVRKEYGPIVKEVDEGMEGRVEGWEMLRQTLENVEMTQRWYTPEGSEERTAVVGSMVQALRVGLSDEAEVQMSALSVVGGIVRCLPLMVEEAVEVVRLLREKVASELAADAVGSEVVVFEELRRTAVKVAKEVEGIVEGDRTLTPLTQREEWRTLLAAVKKRQATPPHA